MLNGSCWSPVSAYSTASPISADQPLGDPVGAGVAVRVRVVDQLALRVQQPVVDGPRVDPDPVDRAARGGEPQTDEHLTTDPGDVPAQGAVVVPHGTVGKPVHLLELQQVGVHGHAGDHHPTGRGAQVDRDDPHGRGTAHRRNAAATPASTGMCSPVVCDRSLLHSTKTALAMFSGSTSRLRIVRWA